MAAPTSRLRPSLPGLLASGLLALALAWFGAGAARAQTAAPEVTFMQLEAGDDGVFLATNVRFELPPVVEDALRKGIAMYFVAHADVYRSRWYWTDKKVASATRHYRLAYQPLTRRWRLNVGSEAQDGGGGLGVTLNQNFDSLSDALAVMQRTSHWKIADVGDVEPEVTHRLVFQFRLDISQLPRPFQIGAVGSPDWNVSVTRSSNLNVERAR